MNSTTLTNAQKFNLHALVVCILILIPNVVDIPQLSDYAMKIVDDRREDAPHLLPEMYMHYSPECELANKLPQLLVDQITICECVQSGGLDPSRLAQTSPYGAGGPGIAVSSQRYSWMESGPRNSIIELPAVAEVDSATSSPGMQRVILKLVLICNFEIKMIVFAEIP